MIETPAGDVLSEVQRTVRLSGSPQFCVVSSGAWQTDALPPKPWLDIPALRYGRDTLQLLLLCGYLTCDAIKFRPA